MLTYLRTMALSHGHGERFQLPDSAHYSRPWRIHELTADFRLEDVWALPTPGGQDDFPLLVEGYAPISPSHFSNGAVGPRCASRWKVGELLGGDGSDDGVGSRVP